MKTRTTDAKQYFVGIGAQKGGTTWLADYLKAHPQVAFSPIKELHHFDCRYAGDLVDDYDASMLKRLQQLVGKLDTGTDCSRQLRLATLLLQRLQMINGDEYYKSYFEGICRDEHRAFGEITPSYCLLGERGFRAILDCYPQARFIFIMRNPADRHWSQLRFDETNRGSKNFSATARLVPSMDIERYTLRTDYRRTLETLYRVVDPARVCTLFFEHLMSPQSSADELRRITSFLGIEFLPPKLEKKVNVSKSVPLDPQQRALLVQRYAAVYRYVAACAERPLPSGWLTDLEYLGEAVHPTFPQRREHDSGASA